MGGLVLYGALGKFTWRMLATVVASQGVVIFLGALVARGLAKADGDNAATTWLWVGVGLAVLCFLAAGLMRRPWGVTLGWVIQLVTFASAVVLPAMLVVGLIFLTLWVRSHSSYAVGSRTSRRLVSRPGPRRGGRGGQRKPHLRRPDGQPFDRPRPSGRRRAGTRRTPRRPGPGGRGPSPTIRSRPCVSSRACRGCSARRGWHTKTGSATRVCRVGCRVHGRQADADRGQPGHHPEPAHHGRSRRRPASSGRAPECLEQPDHDEHRVHRRRALTSTRPHRGRSAVPRALIVSSRRE